MKLNDTLFKLININLQNNVVPMLVGEVGIGKSSWVIALGEKIGSKVFVLACNQLADKSDATAPRLLPDEKSGTYKQVFFPHQVIQDAINYANENPDEYPILFMDELNRTTPDITSSLLSIPTLRQLGSVSLPENLKIITAGNDKGNITVLDDASITRFAKYNVEPDLTVFLEKNPNIHVAIASVLKSNPSTLVCKKITGLLSNKDDTSQTDSNDDEDIFESDEFEDIDNMSQLTVPRTITALSDTLNEFSVSEIQDMLTEINPKTNASMLEEVLVAHTGETQFTMLLMQELVSLSINTNTIKQQIKITKPKEYTQLQKCSTIDEMQDIINNMNNDKQVDLLIYCLQNSNDNTNIIDTLANTIQTINGNAVQTILNLKQAGRLDDDNVQTFIENHTKIVESTKILFA